jgi:hypothetical protein
VSAALSRPVAFTRDALGAIVGVRGPKSAVAEVFAEIGRRADLMRAMVPSSGTVPLLVIVDPAPTARWGACVSCGDPLEAHRGGQCDLCHAALRKALRSAGRLP